MLTKAYYCFYPIICWIGLLEIAQVLTIQDKKDESLTKKNHPGNGKPFGSSGPYLELEQTYDLTTFDFFEKYVKSKRAILLKNFAKQSRAYDLWSDKYLYEASLVHDDVKLLVETQKKESRDQDIIGMSMTEFLNEYKNKDVYIVDQVPFYLKKDLVLPQPLQCEQAPKTLEQIMLWFSSGGTKSVTHTDDYENILCLYDGIKEIIMVDYYKHKLIVDKLIDEPRGSYSSMDVDSVDYDLYPGIEWLEYYKINLTAGDCIYIPFKWLHQVRSYNRNLGVNFWFNYEKIFHNNQFSEECMKNKLDFTKTIDKYNFTSTKNDFYMNFKFYIMRQVNLGNRKLENWVDLIVHESNKNHNSNHKIIELVKELYDLIDFNGDGYLSNEEIIELDENSLEQTAGLLNEIDDIDKEETNFENKINEIIKNEF